MRMRKELKINGYARCISTGILTPYIKKGQVCEVVYVNSVHPTFKIKGRAMRYSFSDFEPATKEDFEKQQLMEGLG